MANLNKVLLAGNLTRDPEVRYTPSRMPVAEFGLAINRRYKSASGELKEETVFVSITAWSKQAELCEQYLKKGASVLVEGRLKFDEWEKDGKKFTKLSVVAERIQFLDKKGGGRQGGDDEGAVDAGVEQDSSSSRSRPTAQKRTVKAESTGESSVAGEHGDDEDLPF